MIDVVFLLIIFFLVSSHMAKQENSIKLELPNADSALDDTASRETLVVNIMADGQWQIGGMFVDENAVAQRLKQRAMQVSQPLQLKIRTDRNVTYDRIEPILRQATAAGVGDVVFSVYQERGS